MSSGQQWSDDCVLGIVENGHKDSEHLRYLCWHAHIGAWPATDNKINGLKALSCKSRFVYLNM